MGVLVLNASYEPLHLVSIRHAVRMLVREVAVIEEADERRSIGAFPLPKVLRLVRYVAMRWRYGRTPAWSRAALIRRDKGVCAYCGRAARTVDHIEPQSRGGPSNWLNTVAACERCNGRKGDRTLGEAGMVLRFQPYVPTWAEVFIVPRLAA